MQASSVTTGVPLAAATGANGLAARKEVAVFLPVADDDDDVPQAPPKLKAWPRCEHSFDVGENLPSMLLPSKKKVGWIQFKAQLPDTLSECNGLSDTESRASIGSSSYLSN